MTILLTGASGFVGKHVRAQMECVPLEDDRGEVDLRDAERVSQVVARISPQAVIHLAAQSHVPTSFKDPLGTFHINFHGTFHLLSALKLAGFRGRFLFVGSGDMYGLVEESALPVTESQPLKPRNPYSVSKVAAEALCYQWSQTEGFEIMMARPFNHIGPGQDARFAMADFAQQLVNIHQGKQNPALQVGDIDVTRDFTDVRDVVRAYRMILEKGVNGTVYNVCSGQERTIREMILTMAGQLNIHPVIQQQSDRLRPSEQKRMMGSYQKINRDTGWTPEIPLEQSLKDLLGDLQKHG
ncbi:MAG: GDP-mannose 4,6-dehydratase [Deltaproteobacteria bacterium]|nr:GDP-mannose 4,6-dehydratase [Deltaproteobacteria bacterium]